MTTQKVKLLVLLPAILTFVAPTSFAQNSNTGAKSPAAKNTNIGPKVFDKVEKMPDAPYDVSEYLSKNLRYPEAVKKNKVQGRVMLKFIVDKEGNITDVHVINSVDESLSKEAVRVVSSMPKWQPGEHEGKPVPVYFYLPIVFKLS